MSKSPETKYYPPVEEKINVISHAFGFVLSLVGLILLIIKTSQHEDVLHLISACVFGTSLIILYAASTLYHSAKNELVRKRYKVFDHVAIYFLIAGSYTPFTLVTLKGGTGWMIFGVIWSAALAGMILKLFFTGRYSLLSTITYVLVGGVIFIDLEPLLDNLSHAGLMWVMTGGAAYIIGAILYSIKAIKFNHAIFHLLVLIGSFCHYSAVYFHVFSGE